MTPTTKRILRLPDVEDKTGYKRSTIYMMVKAGKFPAPICLGLRAVGWLETDLDEWLDKRIDASRKPGGEAWHEKLRQNGVQND